MITEVNNQTNQIQQEQKPIEQKPIEQIPNSENLVSNKILKEFCPEQQKEKQEKTKGQKKKSKKTEDETNIPNSKNLVSDKILSEFCIEQNEQTNEFISLENYQQVQTPNSENLVSNKILKEFCPEQIYQKNKKEFILLQKELLNSVVGKQIQQPESQITAKTKYNLIFLVRIDLIIQFLKDSNNPENFNEFMKIREKFGVVHKLYWNLYLKKTKKEDVENLRFWVDHVIESGMKKSYSQGEKNNLNLQVMYNQHRQKFFQILRNQKYFGNASIQMCVKGTKFSDNENKNRENQIFIPREVIADFIDLMEMQVEFDLEQMNETEVSEPEKQYKKKMQVSVWY